jgi:hypothetical protein
MRLQPNRPFAGEQPAVTIDAGLPLGPHRFRLEVVGTSGLRSQPAEVVVVVTSAIAHDLKLGDRTGSNDARRGRTRT